MSDEDVIEKLERAFAKIGHMLVREFDPNWANTKSAPSGLEGTIEKIETALAINDEVSEENGESLLKAMHQNPAPAEKSGAKGEFTEGTRVEVVSEDMRNGIEGVIVGKSRGWMKLLIEVGNEAYEPKGYVSVRVSNVKVLTKEGNNPTVDDIENAELPIPEDYVQPKGDHCGNHRLKVGVHAGKSIHEIYTDVDGNETFFKYLVKGPSGAYTQKDVDSAKEYLALRGVDIE